MVRLDGQSMILAAPSSVYVDDEKALIKDLAQPCQQDRRGVVEWTSILAKVLVASAALYVVFHGWASLRTQPVLDPHPDIWANIKPHYPQSKVKGPLHWVNCFPNPQKDTNQHKFHCGYLDVPLDYTNTSDPRTARIALVKYQVGKHKSERTLFVNPGGPGGSGTFQAFWNGEFYSTNYTGGTMDVVGFDPRGVNMSSPAIVCSQNDAYEDRWRLLVGQFPEGALAQHQARLTDSYFDATWKACEQQHGDILRFMTTAFVARDVDRIREALGEEELTAAVFSYGTHLMQEYAALFPDRVGRLVLDGVQYARSARTIKGLFYSVLGNVTEIWELGIIGECVRSGPKGCPLLEDGENISAKELQTRLETFLDHLKDHPIPATHPELGPGVVTYEWVHAILFHALYQPGAWPGAARMLHQLERHRNGTLALEMGTFAYDPHKNPKHAWHDWKGVHIPSAKWNMLENTVFCSDAFPTVQGGEDGELTVDEYLQYYKKAAITHRISAAYMYQLFLSCRTFPKNLPPAEVYRGNYTAKLKNPILMVSSTYDPVTPLFNAREAQAEWGTDNVKLLIHEGYGHCSRAQPSKCSDQFVRNLLQHGQWPEQAEVVCTADELPYPHGKE